MCRTNKYARSKKMAVNVWNVAEIDKITKEMIKSGGECVIEWI